MFAAMEDVAGQAAETKRKTVVEIEEGARGGEGEAENQEKAAEVAERVHGRSVVKKVVLRQRTVTEERRLKKKRPFADGTWIVRTWGAAVLRLYMSGRRRLDEVEAGEEIADFEGGGFWGVGAVGAVVADAGAEVVADGAWGGFLGVGGAHGVAPFGDGGFGFQDHGDDFA